jgi:hypothetical protein
VSFLSPGSTSRKAFNISFGDPGTPAVNPTAYSWDPAYTNAAAGWPTVLSNQNRRAVITSAASFTSGGVRTSAVFTTKSYAEVLVSVMDSFRGAGVGIIDSSQPTTEIFYTAGAYGICGVTNGSGIPIGTCLNGAQAGNGACATPDGTVVGLAFDPTTGNYWISINGVWISGNPATNTAPTATLPLAGATYQIYSNQYGQSGGGLTADQTINVTLGEFAYAPPAGFASFSGG